MPRELAKYEENDFRTSLAETIAWCVKHGSLDDSERSLRTFTPIYESLITRSEQVRTIAKQRSERCKEEAGLLRLDPAINLAGGRLLAYFPDTDLYDGAAENETGGFFDAHNRPPEDTWVLYFDDYELVGRGDKPLFAHFEGFLIAWIPQNFIELANSGIEVNPEQCIQWFDTLDIPLIKQFRELHILE